MAAQSKTKTAAVFLNGDAPHEEPLRRAMLLSPSFFLFTDGAYHYAPLMDLVPDLIIGDFDSIVTLPCDVSLLKLADQNTTDFEKALHYLVTSGFEKVLVLGGTGKQHDHFLGNLSAAKRYQLELDIVFFDQSQYFFLGGRETIIETQKGKIISLYPFPEAHGIRTEGLEYALNHEHLNMHSRIGTRNISTNHQVSIVKDSGDLWIFVSY